MHPTTTIAAIATAPGRGSVGIVRISGPLCLDLAAKIARLQPQARYAHYVPFYDKNNKLIDQGIILYFPAPNSFTGEDIIEFQCHGGPIILDVLLETLLNYGAVQAQPGEFSQRAFLNNKLDLAQAEAIADLIAATSRQAAAMAMQSLQGVFSDKVKSLLEQLIHLRMYVEAAIDFPEEEIDFIQDGKVEKLALEILTSIESTLMAAQQGNLMRDGMKVVLAGRPNAGKSSLMNALAGYEKALVTDIAGTTRDVLHEQLHLDGMPLHLIDTAGLRDTEDLVEQLGVARAWEEIIHADRILLLVDAQTTSSLDPKIIWPEFVQRLPYPERLTLVRNKIDLTAEKAGLDNSTPTPVVRLAAKQKLGVAALREHLKQVMGLATTTEGAFSARRRHLQALIQAQTIIYTGLQELRLNGSGELFAEDLRQAQHHLSEITGEFSADDLLGKIFSEFCIGK